ncbi:MAG: hypothetical protein J1F64_05110 [Oscillospiraceae bacterium]|nr:hypothetical protein [Oscillospiraceae bacterium]
MNKKNLLRVFAFICTAAMISNSVIVTAKIDTENYSEDIVDTEIDDTEIAGTEIDTGYEGIYTNTDEIFGTEKNDEEKAESGNLILPVSELPEKENVRTLPAGKIFNETAELFEDEDVFPLTIEKMGYKKDPWSDNIVAVNGSYNDSFLAYSNTDGSVTPIDMGTGVYYDKNQIKDFLDVTYLSAAGTYLSGIKNDGTVFTTRPTPAYGISGVTNLWENIAQISAYETYILGLKKDGNVIYEKMYENSSTDKNIEFLRDISEWSDIVKVSAAQYNAVGLCKDGTVKNVTQTENQTSHKVYGDECTEWSNITDIVATESFTVGVTADHKVKVADATLSDFGYNVTQESGKDEWSDIAKVAAYSHSDTGYIVGLKTDGTVVMSTQKTPFSDTVLAGLTGAISKWEDIVDIYAAKDYILAETKSGEFVYAVAQINSTSTLKAGYLSKINEISDIEKQLRPTVSYIYAKDEALGYDTCRLNIANNYESNFSDTKYDLTIMEYDEENDRIVCIPLEKDENGNTLIVNDDGTKTPIRVTEETKYDILTFKNDVPSKYKKEISVNRDDFVAEIVVNGANSYVSRDGAPVEFSFTAVYNGKETDAYDLRYVDNYRDSADNANDYTAGEKIKVNSVSSSFDMYGELKDSAVYKSDGTIEKAAIKTDFVNRKYYYFYSPSDYSCYYPEPSYPMTELGYQRMQAGELMTKSNIVKAAAGSKLALVLQTNGTVQGSYNSEVTDKVRQEAIQGNVFKMASPATNNSVTQASTVGAFKETDYSCVGNWRMISDIAVGNAHVLGLRQDGTVIAAGSNDNNQSDVTEWNDIVKIAAGSYHSVGLKNDGTVVAAGSNARNQCAVSQWQNIYSIAAGANYTVGLTNDGEILFAGDTSQGQDDVSSWSRDIIDISAGTNTVMGLDKYGKVTFAGLDAAELNEKVSDWENIVSIEAGANMFVGIDIEGYLHYAYPKTLSKDADIDGAVLYINGGGDKWVSMQGEGKTENWYKPENRGPVFDYLNYNLVSVDKDGNYRKIRYSAAAVGDYSMVFVTEDGYVLNAIYDNPETKNGGPLQDTKFQLISNRNVINGPTILNNYLSGDYTSDNLKIRFEDTTSKSFEWNYTTKREDDPTTRGIKYSGTFKMSNSENDSVLKLYPTSSDANRDVGSIVTYYYTFKNPEINILVKPYEDSGKIFVDVTLKPTISGYDEIYYTINDIDGKNKKNPSNNANDKNSIRYDKKITLDEPKLLNVIAYCGNEKSSVTEFTISIPENLDEYKNATYVEDTEIEQNTVWEKSKSPYYVQNDLRINTGATLTIEPGVDVKCGKDVKIIVNGSLSALGTEDDPINFANYTTDNWAGIDFVTGINNIDKNNAFGYVNITGANDGVFLATPITTFKNYKDDDNGGYAEIGNINIIDGVNAMTVNSRSYHISDSKFNNNEKTAFNVTVNGRGTVANGCEFSYSGTGLNVNGENIDVTNSKIIQNSEVGVQTNSVTSCSVTGSEIYNNLLNVRTGIVPDPDNTLLDFRYNYWFNFSETFIRKTIRDYDNDKTFSKVNITGFDDSRKADYEKIEITIPKNQNNVMFSPATAKDTESISFEVSEGYTEGMEFIAAVYTKGGELAAVYKAVPDINRNVTFSTVGENKKPDPALSNPDIGRIKIFAWDDMTTMVPVLNPVVIE